MNAAIERPAGTAKPRARSAAAPVATAANSMEHTLLQGVPDPVDELMDQLHIAQTAACLLSINFGGDGPFEPRSEAPGLHGMVAALATAATTAASMVRYQRRHAPLVEQSAAMAEFMLACSQSQRGDGQGFTLGDSLLCSSFHSIEMLLEQAMKEVHP